MCITTWQELFMTDSEIRERLSVRVRPEVKRSLKIQALDSGMQVGEFLEWALTEAGLLDEEGSEAGSAGTQPALTQHGSRT